MEARLSKVGENRDGTMRLVHRIGLIVPTSNITMERSCGRSLSRLRSSDGTSVFATHSARVRMQNVTPEELRR
jgi:maleate isomerase